MIKADNDKPHAVNHQPEECREGRARDLVPRGGEDVAQDKRSLVHASRREELLGRGPFELDALETVCVGRRSEVGVSRVGSAARPSEGLGEADAQTRCVGPARKSAVERQLKEFCCAVERKVAHRLMRGALGVRSRPLLLTGAHEVSGHRLGVGVGQGLEHVRKSVVMDSCPVGGEMREYGFADPIVGVFDHLVTPAQPHVDEPASLQERHRIVQPRFDLRGGSNRRHRKRTATEGDHLEQTARSVGQSLQPFGDSRFERDRPPGSVARAVTAANELLEKKRVPIRFAGGGSGHRLRCFVSGSEEVLGQSPGALEIKWTHGEVSRLGPVGPVSLHLGEKRARVRFLVARSHDEKDRGRVGRSHEFEQKSSAVRIAPVRVVHMDDCRLSLCEGRKEFAQHREGSSPHALRVPEGVFASLRDFGNAAQHGEQSGERPDVLRQGHLRAQVRKPEQVAAESVDPAVDGLVRHRLPLVGAAGEDQGVPAARKLIDETLDQRCLAHARGPHDANGHAASGPCSFEGIAQRGEMSLMAHERPRAWGGDRELGGTRAVVSSHPEPA